MTPAPIYILWGGKAVKRYLRHSTVIKILDRKLSLESFAVRYMDAGAWVTESAADYLSKIRKCGKL